MTKEMTNKEVKAMLDKAYIWANMPGMADNQIIGNAKTFAIAMQPGLDIWLKDKPEEYHEAFTRHAYEYFSTNHSLFPLVVGIALAMEQERCTNGTVDVNAISSVKAALMGPLAGIGDSIIFNVYRVVIAGIAISLASGGNFLGPLFFFLFFVVGLLIFKRYLIEAGYKFGTSFVTKALQGGSFTLVTNAASSVGAVIIGSMIVSNVKVNVAWTPDIFGAVFEVQPILDTILPGLLPLLLFVVCYKALKKGMSPILLIFTVIFICIVLCFFGIL